jgi:hypothetical protein
MKLAVLVYGWFEGSTVGSSGWVAHPPLCELGAATPVFITTPAFLVQHRQHREQTRRLLATASANGQLRLAETNQQVLDNLDRIIGALEADHGEADDGQKVADAG